MTEKGAKRRASIGFVLATLGIDALGFGIVVPVVPNLVVRLSHLPPSAASFWVGALLAAFSAMQFLCAPLLGALSDRFGRRPVLLLSLSGVCANYLMLAWAPSLPWLFVGRLIAGATAANVSAATAYIADVTPPAQRAQRFGLVGAMFGLGFVLGPAVGGLLGGYGLRLPFLAAAALAGVNVLYGIFVLPESLPPDRRRAFEWRLANPVGTLGAVVADPAYVRLALAWCCAWFALGALQSSFVLANDLRLGWGPAENGAALAAVGVGSALVQGLVVRRLVPFLGERRAALLGYVLAALAYLLFAFAVRGWIVYAGIAVQALGAISGPAVQAMVSMRAGPDRQGEVQGALASLQGLTAIASPLIAGWLFGAFAPLGLPGAPFLLAAATYLLAFAAVRGLGRRPRRDEPGREGSDRGEAAVRLQDG
jgi:MFS transporter, DHA1 family, tetracycline resistance protein